MHQGKTQICEKTQVLRWDDWLLRRKWRNKDKLHESKLQQIEGFHDKVEVVFGLLLE